MRRKLAYILLNLALIVGTGAIIGELAAKMDTDVDYGSGRDLYFRLSKKGTTYEGLKETDYLGYGDGEATYDTINSVAEEMENRLSSWGINGNVSKEGYDLIKVTLRVEGDNETEYQYLENYLSFSGQHITVAAGSNDSDIQKGAPTGDNYADNAMFKGQTAKIEYINGNVPVVTIPVNFPGKDGELGKLITYCSENTKAADTSAGTEEKNCFLVLWANKQANDSFLTATSSDEEVKDSNMAKRLIFGENAANAWFTDSSNEDNNYKKLQLVPSSEAIQNGEYDSSKSGAAYKAAFYYTSLLNASSYQDDFDCDVNFLYSHRSTAVVDPLMSAGAWHLSPTFGPTMIASISTIVLLTLIAAMIFKMGALATLANVFLALLGGFALFAYFHAAFGIGAVVGFLLGALVTAFGTIYYFAKFKEQLYEGRSSKKAHQEAIKKTTWPVLDSSIVSIIVGLCIYGFVPSAIGAMGLSLILTSFFGLIINILLLRLQGYLLSHDKGTDGRLPNLYGVDGAQIPNLLNEEKPTYKGPYANVNFLKHKKVNLIIGGVFLLASIIGLSVFSSLGEPYNYSGAYNDSTSLFIEYRTLSGDTPTYSKVEDIETKFLNEIYYKDKCILEYIPKNGIVLESETLYDSNSIEGTEEAYTAYYFHITLNTYINPNDGYMVTVGENTIPFKQFAEEKGLYGTMNNVQIESGTPTIGTIYLALGIGTIATFVYSLLRYRPSRALATSILSLGSSVIVTGFFALSRLAVSPLASIAVLTSFLLAYLLNSVILNKEKEINKDSREHQKDNFLFRDNCLMKANSESAGDLITYSLVAFAGLLSFFGFAPTTYWPIFLGAMIGLGFAIYFALTLLSPLSIYISEIIRKASASIKESWKKPNNNKPNSGNLPSNRRKEPEEAIFIGIND